MSRLERLKERKRKNRIKATACGLALSLAIGSVQGLGTYALFTDTENVASNLAISTGDVDIQEYTTRISVEDGTDTISGSVFEGDLIKNGEEKSKTFEISNQGTLNQNLKIELSTNSPRIDDNTLEQIKYKLEVKDGTTSIQTINTNFKEIKSGKYNDYKLEAVGILKPNPNRKLSFISTISLKGANIELSNATDVDFKLNIVATQLGYTNNNGFTDSYNQENIFTIVPQEGGYIDVFFTNWGREWISIILPGEFEIVKDQGKGQFKNVKELLLSGLFNIHTIYKNDGTKFDTNSAIGWNFKADQKLTAKVKINGSTEYWDIYFRYRNWDLQAYYVVRPQLKEVTDLEAPSELEVLEPPKVEEEILPSEPEVIEPPKAEEEEEQSKPEVIESPKDEEIVAQKKDEDLE